MIRNFYSDYAPSFKDLEICVLTSLIRYHDFYLALVYKKEKVWFISIIN